MFTVKPQLYYHHSELLKTYGGHIRSSIINEEPIQLEFKYSNSDDTLVSDYKILPTDSSFLKLDYVPVIYKMRDESTHLFYVLKGNEQLLLKDLIC